MKIKLFSILAEEIGPSVEIDLKDPFYSQDVKDAIKQKYPDYADVLDQSLVAINQEYANDTAVLQKDVDEIAIIPPVSGG